MSYGFQKGGPVDAPDGERKMQAAPVPTSGGQAIAAAIVMVSITLWLRGFIGFSGTLPLLCGLLLLVMGIGAIDDARTISTRIKFILLGIIALAATAFGAHVEHIFLPYADSIFYISALLTIPGCALWIFVMMNATNFMDGSNGLAMGTLLIMSVAVAFGLDKTQFLESDLRYLAWIMASSILGFLFWNLQGKLYAGDAGSLFGGGAFAILGLYAAKDGNIWFPATLALPFLVDVFITLLWRARRGHNLLTPHRHHAYQLFIRSGWSHIKTAILWWTLAAICALAALWAAGDSKAMSTWVFFGLLATGCILWGLQRRQYGSKVVGEP